MGVVDESVKDGVPEGGVSDDVVPVLDGELGGKDGSAAGVAVVEDFEQVVAALAGQGGEPPVVEDEQPGSGEALDEPGVGAVGPGEGELVEEPGDAEVEGRDAEAAGLVAQRAGQAGFAGSGGAADQNGLTVLDPPPRGEAKDEGTVETAPGGGWRSSLFRGEELLWMRAPLSDSGRPLTRRAIRPTFPS